MSLANSGTPRNMRAANMGQTLLLPLTRGKKCGRRHKAALPSLRPSVPSHAQQKPGMLRGRLNNESANDQREDLLQKATELAC